MTHGYRMSHVLLINMCTYAKKELYRFKSFQKIRFVFENATVIVCDGSSVRLVRP